MKHYTGLKGDEIDLIRFRKWVSDKTATGAAKRGYRRRERAVLKRMTAELVAEEMGDDFAYWDNELDVAASEHERLAYEYEDAMWCSDNFGDDVDWDYYEMRFDELRKRIDVAYREWYAAA